MGQAIAGSTASRRSLYGFAERPGKERAVAETKEGKKWVPVKPYTREGPDGKPVHVHRHDRSTPTKK